jgi:prepilin-type N-terminal cleavage/methylation domain-containing protein
MKSLSSYKKGSHQAGFTLVEVLVVVAIMAVLAGLSIAAFRYSQVQSKRQTATAAIKAIQSGLEKYSAENGEYPLPRDPEKVDTFQGKSYKIGGAQALYQAMTGDGSSAIFTAATGSPSNGIIEDTELEAQMYAEMPPSMKTTKDPFILVDPFGKPYQYVRVDFGNGSARSATGDLSTRQAKVPTINPTFDIWSYADDVKNTDKTDIESREAQDVSGGWVKNW